MMFLADLVLLFFSDIEEDVVSLHQFSTELIVEATARCIALIQPDQEAPPSRLPPSMAAKFRIGTALATSLQVT